MSLWRAACSIALLSIGCAIFAYELIVDPLYELPSIKIGINLYGAFFIVWAYFLVREHIEIEPWELDDSITRLRAVNHLLTAVFVIAVFRLVFLKAGMPTTKNLAVLGVGFLWGIGASNLQYLYRKSKSLDRQ